MSENRNRGIRDFSKYDSMPTEELEEILRLDASAPEGEESDVELILYVMGVLANKKNTDNTGKTALEAWESFQQYYLPSEEELPEFTQEPKKSAKPFRPWLRRLTAAAAAIVLMVCIPLTANAFGWEEFWDVIAQWAKETFSFVSGDDTEVSEPSPSYNGEAASLQELMTKNNVDAEIIPTWIPNGYVLEVLEQDITPMQRIYMATYKDGDKYLRIRVQTFVSSDSHNMEVEEEILDTYVSGGVEYYIFENVDQLRVVWMIDTYECNISGDVSLDELKMMIDSIGKG